MINYLNNWATLLGYLFCNCTPSCERLKNCWFGWADDERRVPHPFWFSSWTHLEDYFYSIPMLIKKEEDKWLPANVANVSDCHIRDIHESTIWWFVRPRWSYGTIEIRMLDAISPYMICQVVLKFIKLLRIIKKEENLPKISSSLWWHLLKGELNFYHYAKPILALVLM